MNRVPSIEQIAIAAAVWATGSVVGPALGTLVVMLLGWAFGVLVGVWRIRFEPDDCRRRVKTLGFVIVSFGVTIGTSALAANALSSTLGRDPAEILWLVAFAIPAIGPTWISIGAWMMSLLRRTIERYLGLSK